MAESLRKVGYDCAVAESGDEGSAQLERDAFEIVVTDLKMKDVGGLEILAKSKEVLPDAEVILVTGHGTVQSAVEAMQQGAFNYLLKPLDLKQLRAVVDNAAAEPAPAAGERRAEPPAGREVRLRGGHRQQPADARA